MDGYSNNMTLLLNKIERRLGTQPLHLPEHLQKDKWGDVIIEDYVPNELTIRSVLLNGVEQEFDENQNYINKAPKNIVENERETLKKEKQELDIILDKLK